MQLKVFQKLGYFPNLEDISEGLLNHLRTVAGLPPETLPLASRNTLYQHQSAVLKFLSVKGYDETARKLMIKTVFEAAQVMDNPADLINAAIEELIRERFEIPAFSTLDRVVRRVRSLVNQRLWNTIFQRLDPADMTRLDNLLLPNAKAFRTPYNSSSNCRKSRHSRISMNFSRISNGCSDWAISSPS